MITSTDVHDRRTTSLGPVTSGLFERASRWRRARVFHPHGVTVCGEIEVGAGLAGTELFRPGARVAAVVRFSRGVGVPTPWPDVLGVAVRAVDAYGPGRHQDLLAVTALPVTVARFVLVPARAYDGVEYSSLLPSQVGGQRYLFGAVVAAATSPLVTLDEIAHAAREGTLQVRLRAARPLEPWREVATFTATGVLSQEEGEAVRFDPWNTGGGIEPDGWLQRWRASAYPASQRGRPDTPIS